jgi:hypothetical protein
MPRMFALRLRALVAALDVALTSEQFGVMGIHIVRFNYRRDELVVALQMFYDPTSPFVMKTFEAWAMRNLLRFRTFRHQPAYFSRLILYTIVLYFVSSDNAPDRRICLSNIQEILRYGSVVNSDGGFHPNESMSQRNIKLNERSFSKDHR